MLEFCRDALQGARNDLGFRSMGAGIARRRHALAAHWRFHLEHSKSMQSAWMRKLVDLAEGDCRLDAVAVLGAGRLFDVDIAQLGRVFRETALVDADRRCKVSWQREAARLPTGTTLRQSISEVTGVLSDWTTNFARAVAGRWDADMQLLSDWASAAELLPTDFSQYFSGGRRPDALISLNLLSQIPIVWQDGVERILARKYGFKQVREAEDEWISAFSASAKLLVQQHLKSLNESKAQAILILTDLEYAYYRSDIRYRGRSYEPEPLIYSPDKSGNDAGWHSNSELARRHGLDRAVTACEVLPALYGVELENEVEMRRLFSNYDLAGSKSWLWHIQPLGAEPCAARAGDWGTIHRVGAFELRRRCSPESEANSAANSAADSVADLRSRLPKADG